MHRPPRRETPYSPAYLRYALALLTVVYACNFIDRQILVILQESIKHEMGLSDAALGVLSGFTFAIFYVTAGIPVARLADRGVRRDVITAAVGIWSFMTAISGLVQNYWQLVAARIGVGIGEAGGSPPAHAIITDYFPPERRARALAIYSTGIYIGILLGFGLGGWLNQYLGWRVAFMVVGAPGLAIALLVQFTIKEPSRGLSDGLVIAEPQPGLGETARTLWGLVPFRLLALGTALVSFVGYSSTNFAPSFLARSFHLGSGQIGTLLALSVGIGGMCGTLLGGFLSDRLGARDRRWYLWIPALGVLLAVPIHVAAYLSNNPGAAVAFLFLTFVFQSTYLAPCIAVSHGLVPPALRALVSALLFFVLNLIGLGLGPLTTGLISDQLTAPFGNESLRWALVIVGIVYLPAAATFMIGATRLQVESFRGRVP